MSCLPFCSHALQSRPSACGTRSLYAPRPPASNRGKGTRASPFPTSLRPVRGWVGWGKLERQRMGTDIHDTKSATVSTCRVFSKSSCAWRSRPGAVRDVRPLRRTPARQQQGEGYTGKPFPPRPAATTTVKTHGLVLAGAQATTGGRQPRPRRSRGWPCVAHPAKCRA